MAQDLNTNGLVKVASVIRPAGDFSVVEASDILIGEIKIGQDDFGLPTYEEIGERLSVRLQTLKDTVGGLLDSVGGEFSQEVQDRLTELHNKIYGTDDAGGIAGQVDKLVQDLSAFSGQTSEEINTKVQGVLDQLDVKLTEVNTQLAGITGDIDNRFSDINTQLDPTSENSIIKQLQNYTDSEVQKIQDSLDSLTDLDLDELSNTVTQVQEDLKNLGVDNINDNITQLNKELNDIKADLGDDFSTTWDDIKLTTEGLVGRAGTLETYKQTLETKLGDLNGIEGTLTENLSTIEGEQKNLKVTTEGLRADYNSFKQTTGEQLITLGTVEDNLSTLQANHTQLQTNFNDIILDPENGLRTRFGTLESTVADFNISGEGGVLDRLGDLENSLGDENSGVIKDISALTTRFDQLNIEGENGVLEQIEQATQDLEALQKELETADLGELADKIDTLDGLYSSVVKDLGLGTDESILSKVTNLSGEVHEVSSSVATFEDTAEGITSEINTLKSRTGTIEGSVNELDGTVSEISGKTEALETTTTTLQTRAESIEASVSSVATDVSNVTARVTTAEGTVSEVQRDIQTLTATTASLTVEKDEISAAVTELSNTVETTQSDITTLTGEISTLKTTTDTLATKSELNVAKNEITATVSGIQSTQETLQTSIQTAGTRLDTLETKSKDFVTQASLDVELDSISQNISSVQQEANNKITALTAEDGTVAKMINNETKNLVSNTTFTTGLGNISGSVEKLEETVTSNTNNITGLTKRHEDLSADVATLVLNPETGLKAHINNLREEYDTLTDGFGGTLSEMQTTHNEMAELVLDPQDGFQVKIQSLERTSDAAKKQIGDVSDINTKLSADITGITGEVQKVSERLDGVSTTLGTQFKQTEENFSLAINQAKEDIRGEGASKVVTSTGFTFDETGLTITKSDSSFYTQIDDNGMEVKYNDNAILVADNQGVSAQDLHARTYLIIGDQSRFETYTKNDSERTGCFWIGG